MSMLSFENLLYMDLLFNFCFNIDSNLNNWFDVGDVGDGRRLIPLSEVMAAVLRAKNVR